MSNQRKADHIDLFAIDHEIDRAGNHFDRIRLTHRALPEIALSEVDTACFFLRKTLSFPFIISSMTGGNSKQLVQLNQHLATAAEATGVAMGVGSQRIALSDQSAMKSFQLRQYAPTVPLIANIGAVQLNHGLELSQLDDIIGMLQADALYLHFNPLQEAIQPEGDTNFASLAEKIEAAVRHVSIPVIAKEVGCGFSLPDLQLLKQAGIQWIDVSGSGGSSWSRLENHRRKAMGLDDDLGIVYQDWGIPTPQAIRIAKQCSGLKIIASGGLRNGIDMLKSMVLGADLCAMAAPLLKSAQQDTSAVIKMIKQLQDQFRLGLFLMGCATIKQAKGNKDLISQK